MPRAQAANGGDYLLPFAVRMWIADVVAVVNQGTHVASETASWKESACMGRCMW